MKLWLEGLIKDYIKEYENREEIKTKWREPIIRYASARDEDFLKLKEIVDKGHALPRDLLKDGETVVAYFIPFNEEIAKSNVKGREASKEWAIAYIETNTLIKEINIHIQRELEVKGYSSNIIPATHNFDKERLISMWSHRHVAYFTGLGTFGLNNMMITDKGCCGRIGTFVTSLKLEPSEKNFEERCLFKKNGKCKICINRCVNDALKVEGFDRHKCYEMCLYNDEFHKDLGKADVCGKCLVNLPCTLNSPK